MLKQEIRSCTDSLERQAFSNGKTISLEPKVELAIAA
jgi:hypothetical protein